MERFTLFLESTILAFAVTLVIALVASGIGINFGNPWNAVICVVIFLIVWCWAGAKTDEYLYFRGKEKKENGE